jgi:hypothetical protein
MATTDNHAAAAGAPKPWWKSKTLWFNAACAALGVAEAQLQLLKPLLGDQAYPILLYAVMVGNAVLRIVTTQGIALSEKK